MLSSDEVVPDEAEDEPEIKDFAYYAQLAEWRIDEAHQYVPQFINPRAFEYCMQAADVYARLAAAAPKRDER